MKAHEASDTWHTKRTPPLFIIKIKIEYKHRVIHALNRTSYSQVESTGTGTYTYIYMSVQPHTGHLQDNLIDADIDVVQSLNIIRTE